MKRSEEVSAEIERLIPMARSLMEKSGFHAPTLFAYTKGTQKMMDVDDMLNRGKRELRHKLLNSDADIHPDKVAKKWREIGDLSKQALAMFLKKQSKEEKWVGYCFISDAKFGKRDREGQKDMYGEALVIYREIAQEDGNIDKNLDFFPYSRDIANDDFGEWLDTEEHLEDNDFSVDDVEANPTFQNILSKGD